MLWKDVELDRSQLSNASVAATLKAMASDTSLAKAVKYFQLTHEFPSTIVTETHETVDLMVKGLQNATRLKFLAVKNCFFLVSQNWIGPQNAL